MEQVVLDTQAPDIISVFLKPCILYFIVVLVLLFSSKRLRLDDSCNNNLNSTLNSVSKSNGKWSCSGDGNLVEPEILEDMGVSMLEDQVSCGSSRKSQCQELATSPLSLDSNRQCKTVNSFESQESVYRSSSFETVDIDRYVLRLAAFRFALTDFLIS